MPNELLNCYSIKYCLVRYLCAVRAKFDYFDVVFNWMLSLHLSFQFGLVAIALVCIWEESYQQLLRKATYIFLRLSSFGGHYSLRLSNIQVESPELKFQIWERLTSDCWENDFQYCEFVFHWRLSSLRLVDILDWYPSFNI